MRQQGKERDSWIPAGWLAALPAWLVSVSAHLVLGIAGCLLIAGTGPAADEESAARPGEIVLARRRANSTEYFTDDGSASQRRLALRPVMGESLVPQPSADDPPAGVAAANSQAPLLPGINLPDRAGERPAGEGLVAGLLPGVQQGKVRLPTSALDEAAILAEDARIPREKLPSGPTAQLSLFGSANAVGRSFVFVIDRSNSMGGNGLGGIQAAAKELAAQIGSLTGEQTFQVIAYNEAPLYLTQRELIPATADNKQRLVRFVANLPAFGQTEHARGLSAALRLEPEVIFLLTDGGDPVLHAGQLREIREEAAGRTSIHCLHFGRGPPSGESNFLARLAAENGGSYVHIDMNTK